MDNHESDDARLARLRRATQGIAPSSGLAARISDEVLESSQRTMFSAALVAVAWKALPIALVLTSLVALIAHSSQHRLDQLTSATRGM